MISIDLNSFVSEKHSGPDVVSMIHYLFWEKGIDYNRLKDLPIPYILNILKTHSWVKEEEEKAYKKAQRKK